MLSKVDIPVGWKQRVKDINFISGVQSYIKDKGSQFSVWELQIWKGRKLESFPMSIKTLIYRLNVYVYE